MLGLLSIIDGSFAAIFFVECNYVYNNGCVVKDCGSGSDVSLPSRAVSVTGLNTNLARNAFLTLRP